MNRFNGLRRQTAFTLLELIVIIALVSILAVYTVPRLNLDAFREAGFSQQAAAAIRYAQKQSIASGCSIKVSLTASSCALNWNNPAAAAGCPADNTTIPNPGNGANNFCPNSKPGSAAGLPVNFNFDKIGRPSAGQNIDLGNKILKVEAETGYTHES